MSAALPYGYLISMNTQGISKSLVIMGQSGLKWERKRKKLEAK